MNMPKTTLALTVAFFLGGMAVSALYHFTGRLSSEPIEVACLEADRHEALRVAVEAATPKVVAAQLVDATPRQVEEYERTVKWPAATPEEDRQEERDARNVLMNLGNVMNDGLCMDRAIADCLEEGGQGILCFNMAKRVCVGYEGPASHCKPDA